MRDEGLISHHRLAIIFCLCGVVATMTGKTLLLLLALVSSPWTAVGAKVKRVRAGKVYSEHDPVHIVVNKVG